MKYITMKMIALIPLSLPITGMANECWAVSNINGYSAYADHDYKFETDGLPNPLVVCFSDDGGSVTGTDARFVKFGKSTLVGLGGNGKGNELVEVYQLDRNKKKLHYIRTRIGTKLVVPVFSDVVSSFVGDAKKISN